MNSELPIHDFENNLDSESFLNENREKFKSSCLKVLRVLFTGKRLTVLEAANMGISSLPRRILDIRRDAGEQPGFEIIDEWVLHPETKKRLYKEYYMKISKRPTKEEVLKRFSNAEFQQPKLL